MRQLITDEDDVRALQESFSGDYEEEKKFKKNQGEYIVYFGDDLNLDLQNAEGYVNFLVIDGIAYAIDGNKVYKSKDEIDLSVLTKYRKDSTESE